MFWLGLRGSTPSCTASSIVCRPRPEHVRGAARQQPGSHGRRIAPHHKWRLRRSSSQAATLAPRKTRPLDVSGAPQARARVSQAIRPSGVAGLTLIVHCFLRRFGGAFGAAAWHATAVLTRRRIGPSCSPERLGWRPAHTLLLTTAADCSDTARSAVAMGVAVWTGLAAARLCPALRATVATLVLARTKRRANRVACILTLASGDLRRGVGSP